MLKKLPLLLTGTTVLVVSCGSATSQQAQAPQQAPPPVYRVLWKYCVPDPKPVDALTDGRKDGCARNHPRLSSDYVWGETDWGETYQPKGILVSQRQNSKYHLYRVAIQSRGCFNSTTLQPKELAYYSADVIFGIKNSIAGTRREIEGVQVIAQRVPPEDLRDILQGESPISLPGRIPCKRLEVSLNP